MADTPETKVTPADEKVTQVAKSDGAEAILNALDTMSKSIDQIDARQTELADKVAKASEVQYPHGVPGAFNIRKGENIMSSRPYSLLRLTKALRMKAQHSEGWKDVAKVELDLSDRLSKAYYGSCSWDSFGGGTMPLMPLGADLLPVEDREIPTDNGKTEVVKGIGRDLAVECQQVMKLGGHADFDELNYALSKVGLGRIAKDMSHNTATSGGVLVAMASQGELIELLRAMEFFSQVGAREIDLPPQGKIRFPRHSTAITIAATSEGATVSESTPAFGELLLSARPYSGLVDVPDELMRFSTSMAVEAWLRSEFVREIGLKADTDMISGGGGTSIQGVINYSGVRTVTASTTGANGDTLDPEDPTRLYADIADQNAPVDSGFFFGCTNTLWGGITTRKASSSGEFMFSVATQLTSGGRATKSLNGERLITSTQIPTNRTKGSGTTLTMLLGGVGSEWIIARAGVVEVAVTDSDASKFQQRLTTLRGTQYLDAGPRHENSFGYIDDLLNA